MLFIYKLIRLVLALGMVFFSIGVWISFNEGSIGQALVTVAFIYILSRPFSSLSKLIAKTTKENKETEELEQKQKEAEAYKKYLTKFGLEYSPDNETETHTLIEGITEAWEREAALKAFHFIKQQYNEAQKQREQNEKKEALIENYRAEFGDDIVSSYQKREVMLGMPKRMVIEIHGEPDEIKKERTEKYLIEDLFYAKPGTKYESGKTGTYKLKVNLKNELVKGFKEY